MPTGRYRTKSYLVRYHTFFYIGVTAHWKCIIERKTEDRFIISSQYSTCRPAKSPFRESNRESECHKCRVGPAAHPLSGTWSVNQFSETLFKESSAQRYLVIQSILWNFIQRIFGSTVPGQSINSLKFYSKNLWLNGTWSVNQFSETLFKESLAQRYLVSQSILKNFIQRIFGSTAPGQ